MQREKKIMEYYIGWNGGNMIAYSYPSARKTAKDAHKKGYEDITITCVKMQYCRLIGKRVATRLWAETYPQNVRTELNVRHVYPLGYVSVSEWEKYIREENPHLCRT